MTATVLFSVHLLLRKVCTYHETEIQMLPSVFRNTLSRAVAKEIINTYKLTGQAVNITLRLTHQYRPIFQRISNAKEDREGEETKSTGAISPCPALRLFLFPGLEQTAEAAFIKLSRGGGPPRLVTRTDTGLLAQWQVASRQGAGYENRTHI